MEYSVIGLLAIVIHFIINNDLFYKEYERTEANTAYRYFLWSVFAYYLTDALWGVIYDTHVVPLIYLDTVLYYIAMAASVVLVGRYVAAYLGFKGKQAVFAQIISYVFAFFVIAMLIVNHFVHIFFWIDENAVYHAYTFRYITLYAQMGLCAIMAIQTAISIRKTKGQLKRRSISIFLFNLIMTTAICLQVLYPLLPLYSIGLLIGTCVIHTFVKLNENAEQKKQMALKNEELASVNEEQYAQLEEITSLNELLKEQQNRRDELHSVLESMAEIFYSLHVIDLVQDTVTEFNSRNEVKQIVNRSEGASTMMRQVMETVVADEYKDAILKFSDLSTLANRMKKKKVISDRFVGNNIGWFLAMFITMEADENKKPTKVIFSTRIIEEDEREKEMLLLRSQTDELTGLLNRRAYEEDIYTHKGVPAEDDFIYISLDVNGLKVVNDTIGHVAGDELIIGACECMKEALSPYGKLYRIGGDEFVGIIFVKDEELNYILNRFDDSMKNWSGNLIDTISISYGGVSKREFPKDSVRQLAATAEKRMYEAKSAYYRKSGMDRRGQQDAHKALCELYTKILKINLTEDTYQIVNMDDSEKNAEKGFADTISQWLMEFGKSGQVHPDDLEEYLTKTDLEYMRHYFKTNKMVHHVFYRRRFADGYKQVMMEMIPANDYSDENQSLFLYVKSIDK